LCNLHFLPCTLNAPQRPASSSILLLVHRGGRTGDMTGPSMVTAGVLGSWWTIPTSFLSVEHVGKSNLPFPSFPFPSSLVSLETPPISTRSPFCQPQEPPPANHTGAMSGSVCWICHLAPRVRSGGDRAIGKGTLGLAVDSKSLSRGTRNDDCTA
jgi:hypothetical protein